MSRLEIAGGVYAERAIWPDWDQVYGSAGRAAAAIRSHVDDVTVYAYASPELLERFTEVASGFSFSFHSKHIAQTISFNYTHGLATPTISPPRKAIIRHPSLVVTGDNVLRFGMLEGDARVEAKRCVYDPQDQIAPEAFSANGSVANALAIVANQTEVLALTGAADVEEAVRELLQVAAVVVVKAGPVGALVYSGGQRHHVPAYRTQFVWPVGSGDVFAAMFAARWAVHGDAPERAADIASRAVASYVESMALPGPPVDELFAGTWAPAQTLPGKVYLASPFFSMGERWLVEEARRSLYALGMQVFSPFHDVGPGPAAQVAPLDLAAVDECDVMFAILDGLDSGTLFEVGYARKAGKPVYALALSVTSEDLKMVEGSNCRVYSDFVTALHHLVWRA